MNARIVITCAAFCALFLGNPAAALPCNGTITTIDAGAATIYMDDRSTGPGEINHWFYLESNGLEDLQTGGFHDAIIGECWEPKPCLGDTCRDWEHWWQEPDTLII